MYQIFAELCLFESFCKLFTFVFQIFNAARQLSHIEVVPKKKKKTNFSQHIV